MKGCIDIVYHSKQYTMECCYNTSNIRLIKDISYLALTGGLWGVFCEDFGENWPRHDTVLYILTRLNDWGYWVYAIDYILRVFAVCLLISLVPYTNIGLMDDPELRAICIIDYIYLCVLTKNVKFSHHCMISIENEYAISTHWTVSCVIESVMTTSMSNERTGILCMKKSTIWNMNMR